MKRSKISGDATATWFAFFLIPTVLCLGLNVEAAENTPTPLPRVGAAADADQTAAAAMDEFVSFDPSLRLPKDIPLAVEWYTPVIGGNAGKIVRAWIRGPHLLAETDKNTLLCLKRATGTEEWRCELSGPLVHAPAVSRENIVVNINNVLVALSRRSGMVRWRLRPEFLMSGACVVADPAKFPEEYPPEWIDLEQIFVGSTAGSFEALVVRARMKEYAKQVYSLPSLSAPEFQLMPSWRKLHREAAVMRDVKFAEGSFAYVSMDRKIRAWSRDGEARGEYRMQGMPSTPITTQVVAGVPYGYVGATDGSVYAFNLFTCGRIWNFPMGETPVGHIAVDSPRTPHVCAVGEKSGLTVLRVERIAKFEDDGVVRGPRGDIVRVLKPESAEEAWRHPAGRGVVSFSPETIYVGEDVAADLTQRVYRKLSAIEKSGGRVRWRTDAAHLSFFIEFHNNWLNADEQMRLYAVTVDNRLISYKEKIVFGGPLTKPRDDQEGQKSPLPASILDEKKPEGGGLLDN